MITFLDAVEQARYAFQRAGYPSAVLEVHVSRADVDALQSEPSVIESVIGQALHPNQHAPARGGMRLFAVVNGVRVYVQA
jgi:hypothetical protein